MKKRIWLVILLIAFCFVVPAQAQEEALKFRLSRDFGYSSGTGRIQGTFSAKVSGPEDLVKVTYYLDDEILGEVTEEPFRLRFVTDNYPLGVHELYALGETADGSVLESNHIRVEFVSAEEGWEVAGKILIPLLALIFVAMGLSFGVTFLRTRKQPPLPPGTPRDYGIAGGAICPGCKRPFKRHFWAPNLVVGKLERCPHCGKWSVVRAEPLSALRAAEQAELEALGSAEGEVPEMSEEERLKRELEASRFDDL